MPVMVVVSTRLDPSCDSFGSRGQTRYPERRCGLRTSIARCFVFGMLGPQAIGAYHPKRLAGAKSLQSPDQDERAEIIGSFRECDVKR